MPAPRPLAVDFPNLTFEGTLIALAMIERIHAGEAPEMAPESYAIPPGLALRDEISRAFRIGRALHERFARHETRGARATRAHVTRLLEQVFGFDDLAEAPHPLALAAGKGRGPVVVVPAADGLDRPSEALSRERRLSASVALQDHLNAREEALWGLATNGMQIRLMRDNASLTRMAYFEADLARIFETDDIASFSLTWLLIHRSRFGRARSPAPDCALERWREEGEREGMAVRDRLAAQVEEALAALGTGFLEANPDLRARLTDGQLDRTAFFNELLKLVYRVIFLMVAEDRNLLHPREADETARAAYVRGYSTERLRALALRRAAWDRHHDRYEGLKVVFAALARGEPRLGLPALGGLFAPGQMPDLREARLPNRALMRAILRLGWTRADDRLARINWARMQTEELGSVYESLLELQPQPAEGGRRLTFATATAEKKGNQRKTTGSYYTPDSLVQALLDTALDPVLDEAEAAEDPEAALLDLTVIDPACGSGHFLIAAAHRIAGRLARIRAGGTPAAEDRRHALRDVVRSCIHGVDRNPMAVELTKVALWIETVDPGLPLGFLDAQIRCGDALLGVFDLKVLEDGIPDAAYKPLTGDDKAVAKHYLKANRDAKAGQGSLDFEGGGGRLPTEPLKNDFHALRALPENTLEDIAEKARRLRSLREARRFHMVEMACNLYIAAFLLPKTGPLPASRGARLVPISEDVWEALAGRQPYGPLIGRAEVAREARAFHWPLEFPDIMAQGGFDVVLGNPPWEVMQLSEKEYFAARKPEVAELSGTARKRAIEALRETDPAAWDEFVSAKQRFEAVNEFARASGRFDLTAKGKVNTYALFAELFANLARGRAGVIVPTGIATDATTAPFFAHLVAARRLARLVDFENSAPIFPSVHRSYKFCLLTLGREERAAHFAFFLTDPGQLADPRRLFTLTPEQIAAINPNTRTAPVFRSRADADLTAHLASVGEPLIRLAGKRELSGYSPIIILNFFSGSNANDAKLFELFWKRGPTSDLCPVLRGADIWQYDHRFPLAYDLKMPGEEWLGDGRFVPKDEVERRLSAKGWRRGWLMGWRDIARATDERTAIATVLPRWACDDTLSLLLPRVEVTKVAALLANLNSMALDYAALSKVGGTHIRKNVIAQFPVLPAPSYTPERLAFLTPRVLELTYTSHALAPFARDLGHDGPPFEWDEDRRAHLRAELDAFFARAYGLSRKQLRYILDPADLTPDEVAGILDPAEEVSDPLDAAGYAARREASDYPSETFRVLKEKEMKQHGEYRTRRLVLEAWARMEADGTFASLGL